jgi:hypothetical protein
MGSYSGCSFDTGVCPLFVLFISSGRTEVWNPFDDNEAISE